MGVRAARRTSAREAEPTADVLVSGSDEPPWRPTRAHGLAGAALVLAGVAAVVVPAAVSGDGPQEAPSVELAVVDGGAALPRRDAAPVRGRVEGGVRIEVVNEGRTPVSLLSAGLSPGAWQVAVLDDLDGSADPGGPGRLLRPGWSAVLVLHRTFTCTPGADHGPVPTSLSVEVAVDGRPRTESLDVRRAPGGLSDLLASASTFCVPTGGRAALGTLGDRGVEFLPLWPGGRGVLPVP